MHTSPLHKVTRSAIGVCYPLFS